ncbi:CCA tRNA nucleotidyltransferase [Sesbania bispinosa]|nr:CCA tRNA nucleotidyltransferase [Sesbania bispinosa]
MGVDKIDSCMKAHPMPLHLIMRPSFLRMWTPHIPRGTISLAVPDNTHRHR